MLDESDELFMLERSEEISEIGVQHPLHPLLFDRSVRATSAWCALRPGRAPYEKPANSGSYTALRTITVARWTILSSSAVTPIGRCCLASPRLGMYTRRTGCARYAPRRSRSDSSARFASTASP